MKLKLLVLILSVLFGATSQAQDESLIIWKFDVPYVGTKESESQFAQNKGILAKAESDWSTPAVLQVGGVNNDRGYYYAAGWDNMQASPKTFFLFSAITIPNDYPAIRVKFYLKSEEWAPTKYVLEYSTDNESTWKSGKILEMNMPEVWQEFNYDIAGVPKNSKISFRIKGGSDKDFSNNNVFLAADNGVDEFEVIGLKTYSSIEEIAQNDVQVKILGDQLVIESLSGIKNIRIFNTSGQLVAKSSNQSPVVISLINKGVYIVEVSTGNGSFVKKIAF